MNDDELIQEITRNVEDDRVDYKEAAAWSSKGDEAASIAKDVMAFANAGGGFIVIGVSQRGGRFEWDGLHPGQLKTWDQTTVNDGLARFAKPPLRVTVRKPKINHTWFAVLQVHPYDLVPHVCHVTISSADGPGDFILRGGLFYMRFENGSSRPLERADEVLALLEDAFARRIAAHAQGSAAHEAIQGKACLAFLDETKIRSNRDRITVTGYLRNEGASPARQVRIQIENAGGQPYAGGGRSSSLEPESRVSFEFGFNPSRPDANGRRFRVRASFYDRKGPDEAVYAVIMERTEASRWQCRLDASESRVSPACAFVQRVSEHIMAPEPVSVPAVAVPFSGRDRRR